MNVPHRSACLLLALLFLSVRPTEAERLNQDNLLEYHSTPAVVSRVSSIDNWKKRRAEIMVGMQEVAGPLPGPEKRVPLEVRIVSETDCGSYLRRQITYQSEPGSRVPAYLLIPKAILDGDVKRPGILCGMPTDDIDGIKACVGLGPPNFKPGRNYGEELAWRGYLVIVPAYPLLADYRPDLKKLGYRSGTMKGIWDSIRALDLLDATPGAVPGGYGAIGLSLGGHTSIFTAVFDERIHVIVSCCGYDSFLDYHNESYWKPGKGWSPERYMPHILDYKRSEIPFDFQELAGALAPRPFLTIATLHDRLFKWKSVDRVIAAARPVYALYNVPNLIAVEHPEGQHEFSGAMRERAYRWLDHYLHRKEYGGSP